MLPLLLAAFCAGVGVLQLQPSLPGPALVATGLAAGVVAVILTVGRTALRHKPLRVGWVARFALVLAVAAGGFAYAAHRAHVRVADALPAAWEDRDIVLVGVVDDLPRATPRGRRFALRVERVETPGALVPTRIGLAWQAPWNESPTAAPVPHVRPGERWRLCVRLRRPHGYANPGSFDLEAWLLERNLRATGYVRSDSANARIDASANHPLDAVQRLRESIRESALKALGAAPHRGVVVALAIGDQSGIDEAEWTVFNRTGVGHLVSVSGLHVTVFALMAGGLAFGVLRRCVRLSSRVPARRLAAVVGLLCAAAYVLVAGAEIPAQRTLAMLAVSALGLWAARPGTGLVVWLWALAAVLLLDPWAVLAVGFWLSFFAVGLLIYVASGRVGSRGRSIRERWELNIATAARAQWAITLGLAPLSLALFQQVSLVGPLANALAIPLVTFAIVPLSLCAAMLPFDAPWQLAHTVLEPLMAVLGWMAEWPSSAWVQHEPPAWAVVSALAGVLLALAPKGMPGRALGIFGCLPLFLVLPRAPEPGAFRLTALDVGQGTALVVQTHRRTLVYDAGPRWHDSADAGSRIVAPFLRASGVRAVDVLVVSHKDADHSGGVLSLLAAVPVDLVLSSLQDDSPIVARQGQRGLALRCRQGQTWTWDDVRFDVLHPQARHYRDALRKANDLSCVLRIRGRWGSALLTGDIEAISEHELVALGESLSADVVIVPHHGSRTSSTPAFIASVAPRYAAFTVGHRNRFGHPRQDVVARYVDAASAVHRTDASGALRFEFASPGPGPPQAHRATHRRYWRTGPAQP